MTTPATYCIQSRLLEVAHRWIDCLFIDMQLDANFNTNVFQPTLVALIERLQLRHSKSTIDPRFYKQTAECVRLLSADGASNKEVALVIFVTRESRARALEFERKVFQTLLAECYIAIQRLGCCNGTLKRILPFSLYRWCSNDIYHLFVNSALVASYATMLIQAADKKANITAPASRKRLRDGAKKKTTKLSIIGNEDEMISLSSSSAVTRRDYALYRAMAILDNDGNDVVDNLSLPPVDNSAEDDIADANDDSCDSVVERINDMSLSSVAASTDDCVHELSDRLFCNDPGDNETVLYDRFRLLFDVHRTLLESCGTEYDALQRWRKNDLFYLYQLCHAQYRICAETNSNIIEMQQPIVKSIETMCSNSLAFETFSAESIERLVQRTLLRFDTPDEIACDTSSNNAIRLLFDSAHQLPRVINSYQAVTGSSIEQRCAQSRLINTRRTSRAEVERFIDNHALVDMQLSLYVVDRSNEPFTVFFAVAHQSATALQLISSVRIFAPDARDGVDFLVVWAPPHNINRSRSNNEQTSPPLQSSNRRRGRRTPRQTALFLCFTQRTWLLLAVGAIPRVLAEMRVTQHSLTDYSLAAIFLHAALKSSEPTIVSHALAGVYSLVSGCRWTRLTHNANGRDLAPHRLDANDDSSGIVNSLEKIAQLCRATGDQDRNSNDNSQKLFAIDVEPLTSAQKSCAKAIEVMLGGERYLVMEKEAAKQLLDVETLAPWLKQIVRSQLAVSLSDAELVRARAETLAQQSSQLIPRVFLSTPDGDGIPRETISGSYESLTSRPPSTLVQQRQQAAIECRCGIVSTACKTLKEQISKGSGQARCFECCICSNIYTNFERYHSMLQQHRQPKQIAFCNNCRQRGVEIPNAMPSKYLLLIGPTSTVPIAQVVSELIRANCTDALYALCRVRRQTFESIADHTLTEPSMATTSNEQDDGSDEKHKATTRSSRPAAHRLGVMVRTARHLKRIPNTDDDSSNDNSIQSIALLELLVTVEKQYLSKESDRHYRPPLSDDLCRRACNSKLITQLALGFELFPLCPAALVESDVYTTCTASADANGNFVEHRPFATIVSDEWLSTTERTTRLLSNARHIAPLAESLPFLLPLTLVNFYAPTETRETAFASSDDSSDNSSDYSSDKEKIE